MSSARSNWRGGSGEGRVLVMGGSSARREGQKAVAAQDRAGVQVACRRRARLVPPPPFLTGHITQQAPSHLGLQAAGLGLQRALPTQLPALLLILEHVTPTPPGLHHAAAHAFEQQTGGVGSGCREGASRAREGKAMGVPDARLRKDAPPCPVPFSGATPRTPHGPRMRPRPPHLRPPEKLSAACSWSIFTPLFPSSSPATLTTLLFRLRLPRSTSRLSRLCGWGERVGGGGGGQKVMESKVGSVRRGVSCNTKH